VVSSTDRLVVHVDMDCFFASAEVLDEPGLAGLPVLVGGSGPRSVVASASYEARGHGVRSAMPMAEALRRCPAAVLRPPRMARYRELSAELRAALESFDGVVEMAGLDEAYLEVGGRAALGLRAERVLGEAVRTLVQRRVGLPASVGLGSTKLVSKLAAGAAKPRTASGSPVPGVGVVVIPAGTELSFLWRQPVGALPGVGSATASLLRRNGVETVRDLAALPAAVVGSGGRHMAQLHEMAWGVDPRPVVADRAVKSISVEHTWPVDIVVLAEAERAVTDLADRLAGRLRDARVEARTVQLKVRYVDFRLATRARTLAMPTAAAPPLAEAGRELLSSLGLGDGVRLLGLAGTGVAPPTARQLSLDPRGGGPDWRAASGVLDAVRQRFGPGALGSARLLDFPAASGGPDGRGTPGKYRQLGQGRSAADRLEAAERQAVLGPGQPGVADR